MTKNNKIIVNTDGGAKGNPGPAAIGAIIKMNDKSKSFSKKIGETTNNVAEYKAVLFALQKIKQILGKKESKNKNIHIKMDSQLVVKQIKGEYKIKEEKLKDLFIDLWNSIQNFKSVEFEFVPREENKEADELVKNLLNTLV